MKSSPEVSNRRAAMRFFARSPVASDPQTFKDIVLVDAVYPISAPISALTPS